MERLEITKAIRTKQSMLNLRVSRNQYTEAYKLEREIAELKKGLNNANSNE